MVSEARAPMAAGAVVTAALCKRSNRVARVLAYALLEWILIALLLANGVFSYLISRFAAFFGLAPPCALCSRLGVDSLFEPRSHGQGAGTEPLRRVLCDAGDMCEDCASSAVSSSGKALLSWMRRSELGERDLACACCGVALESGFISPAFLFPTPVACDVDCGHKRDAAIASLNGDVVFVSEKGPVIELFDEKPLVEEDPIAAMAGLAAQCAEIVGNVLQLVPLQPTDSSTGNTRSMPSRSLGEGNEAIDHVTLKQHDGVKNMDNTNDEKSTVASDDDKVGDMVSRMIDEEITSLVLSQACVEDGFNGEIDGETEEGLVDQQFCEEDSGLNDTNQEILIQSETSENEQGYVKQELFSMLTNPREHEFAIESLEEIIETVHQVDLNNGWNSMPMEAAGHTSGTSTGNTGEEWVQQAELSQQSDSMPIYSREHADEEIEEGKISPTEIKQRLDPVTIDSCKEVHVISIDSTRENQIEQPEVKHALTSMTVGAVDYVSDLFDANISAGDDPADPTEVAPPSLHHLSDGPSTSLNELCPDYNDIESERALDIPTHIEDIDGLQELPDHKAMTSDTKSVDSCIAAMSVDLESIELVSVDQLKYALVSAHKSLSTLYAEFENERSAAAIAADETMAMINRLQEQKAAMQMEAIQYQRLMEEQSEYDQEALQRLNELVVKRDKEKQDLERELELYRRKVHLFEAKERRKMSRHKGDDHNGSSSASSSAEDSDDHSQSFYEGDESAHGLNGSNSSIPTDAVLQETARHLGTLGCSLADFEEERLSILEQLKLLEDRLFDLEDEDSDGVKMDKQFSEENHLIGASNGFSDDDSSFKLHDKRKGVNYRGKKLLPLFDDTTVENGNDLTRQDPEADRSTDVMLEPANEQDKLAIAHEIDQVHERLHALEADREFIKQCVKSLKKGNKGFDLLQEILQHLRDLRRIEQRTRNSEELSPHYLHPYTD
uniref:GTD-binding domain-containing protein n=1 Tax=Oryza brachyantha TaxID=4533 RepID=J3LS23_ORYBR